MNESGREKSALVFAPCENLGLAGEGYCVVAPAMDVTEELVPDVLHARFSNVSEALSQ
jgi:late competence protein required for DNA uptake (superfamily II DNA/RNA helicase)